MHWKIIGAVAFVACGGCAGDGCGRACADPVPEPPPGAALGSPDATAPPALGGSAAKPEVQVPFIDDTVIEPVVSQPSPDQTRESPLTLAAADVADASDDAAVTVAATDTSATDTSATDVAIAATDTLPIETSGEVIDAGAPDALAAGPADALDQAADALDQAADATDAAAAVEDVAAQPPQPTQRWFDQFRAAYLERQLARSDLTTAVSAPNLGVYFEDHREEGEALGTPHAIWLAGRELQVVSPSVEELLLARHSQGFGQVASYQCDVSRYVCRSAPGAPVGAYYRFAPLGPAQAIYLVGVLWYDTSDSSASVGRRIADFDRVIDRRLDELD